MGQRDNPCRIVVCLAAGKQVLAAGDLKTKKRSPHNAANRAVPPMANTHLAKCLGHSPEASLSRRFLSVI
jgi:hypothetical protein